MKRLIHGAIVWDGQERLLPGGAILIEEDTIHGIYRDEIEAREAVAGPIDDIIDGSGRLAMPGLVCAHTHLYSSLARGMALGGYAPNSFAEILEQLWWRLDKGLDPHSVRASALVGTMEAARCGITTLIDHHASPHAIPGSLSILRETVCGRVGLRGAFCYEVTDRDGDDLAAQGIEENARFFSEAAGDPLCAAQFGLHASFTVSDRTLEQVADRIPEGSGVHIHVAEGPEDEAASLSDHGIRVVERLDRFGLLRPTSILAHCLHIDEGEKDRIADRGSIVVHNPRSNMNNAVGAFDLDGFLDRDILTGLGTDGLGANLLAELFTAGILQKHHAGDPLAGGFPALDALLFRGNPEIAGRLLGGRFGRIEAGGPADLALIEYTAPTPLTAQNLLGHLLFGVAVHSLRVADLFTAGRPILRNGGFVEIDEAEAYAHSREQADALWNRIV